MNKTGTIDDNTNSSWNAFVTYNMADVMMLKRLEEFAYMQWLAELKRRWGIFWRIPYWWHHGRHPVQHITKINIGLKERREVI